MAEIRVVALDAGIDAIWDVLARSEQYDFSLKVVRAAYIAGVQAYLGSLCNGSRTEDASRTDFEAHVRRTIQQLPFLEEFAFKMKLDLLSRRLSADAALYDEVWNRLVVDNKAVMAPVGISDMQTASSIPETRMALLKYRDEFLQPRYPTFGTEEVGDEEYFYSSAGMIQKCDECIRGWAQRLAENYQNAWAEEPMAYAPGSTGMSVYPDPEENFGENVRERDENADEGETNDDNDTLQSTSSTTTGAAAARSSQTTKKKNARRPPINLNTPPYSEYWEERPVVGGKDRFYCLLCEADGNKGLSEKRQLGRHFKDVHGIAGPDETT